MKHALPAMTSLFYQGKYASGTAMMYLAQACTCIQFSPLIALQLKREHCWKEKKFELTYRAQPTHRIAVEV